MSSVEATKRPPILGTRYEYRRGGWNLSLHPAQAEACRAVQQELDEGRLLEESTACLCGADGGLLLADRDYFGFRYPLLVCDVCGLLRAGRRFTEDSMQRFYDQWYRSVYQAPQRGGLDAEWLEREQQGQQRHRDITRWCAQVSGATVVDIGCNFGTLLSAFRADGMNVWGCDLGEEHLSIGRERLGLTQLVQGGPATLVSLGVRADLVILDHVFEHLAFPLEELRIIHSLLKPGGRVFVSVPGTWWWTAHNCNYDLLSLLQNAHCFQYELRTLASAFARGGFTLERGDEHVSAVFRASPASTAHRVGAEPASRVVRRMRRMELVRSLRGSASRLARLTGLDRLIGSRQAPVASR